MKKKPTLSLYLCTISLYIFIFSSTFFKMEYIERADIKWKGQARYFYTLSIYSRMSTTCFSLLSNNIFFLTKATII